MLLLLRGKLLDNINILFNIELTKSGIVCFSLENVFIEPDDS